MLPCGTCAARPWDCLYTNYWEANSATSCGYTAILNYMQFAIRRRKIMQKQAWMLCRADIRRSSLILILQQTRINMTVGIGPQATLNWKGCITPSRQYGKQS